MINFQEFQEAVRTATERKLGEPMLVREVLKTNGKVHSLCASDRKCTPSIMLEPFFEEFKAEKLTMNDIVNKMVSIMQEENLEIEDLLHVIYDYEEAKQHLTMQLVNAEWNKEMLNTHPHIPVFGDLAVIFRVRFSSTMTTTISNSLLEKWNTNVDTLYQDAIARSKDTILFQNMAQILFGSEEQEDFFPMWVLTNEEKLYGASSILDEQTLKRIADKLDSSFYILPSSIHEVIIIPEEEQNIEMLNEMVKEVNKSQVEECERLSNHTYFYNRKTEKVEF